MRATSCGASAYGPRDGTFLRFQDMPCRRDPLGSFSDSLHLTTEQFSGQWRRWRRSFAVTQVRCLSARFDSMSMANAGTPNRRSPVAIDPKWGALAPHFLVFNFA